MLDAMLLCCAILGAPEADPPLSDLMMFPSRKVAKANLKLCELHLEHLQKRQKLEVREETWIVFAIEETSKARQMWDWLADAQTGSDYHEASRRAWLAELKAALGPDYYRGRIRFFTRMD